MASLPLDSATVQAAAEAAELRSQQNGLDALRKKLGSGPGMDKKLKEACEGFETIFLNKLWKDMRESVPKEGYLHSKEEESYVSMFDQELMKKMSAAGGIGLGKMLYENLSDHLAKASAGTAARMGGKHEIGPLHKEQAGLPLHAETASTALKADELSDGQAGLPLKPMDIANISEATTTAQAAETPAGPAATAATAAAGEAAPGVILPPGFNGPSPVEPQGPADLAALDQAMAIAGRLEQGRSSQRAVRAYRDAARGEDAVAIPAAPAVSYITPPEAEPQGEESGT